MFFEDVELGDDIGPLEKIASDQDFIDFCNLWGPPTPNRFTDPDEAAKSKLSAYCSRYHDYGVDGPIIHRMG
ncbi:MAG: hypothetical protein Ct9H300mP27_09920 [Chloroflexota bacterium]|nr:MAG: hypothetical protein Ct9H300mP27_09920 [Chloroflexota bacterium]